ncbi:hypothetical protein FRX31_033644 [Thalictrum thalictroides]|uniref:Uncharacterized protein n=1 Tax=Thalictrum thalictroides TaxID=46969 RepID=A0A7J6UW40_THATH|nr:hypothetical protein FRX31_033644 [Thalictrum thalictroides]
MGPWLDSVEVLSSLWATRPQDDDNSCQTTSDLQIGSTSSTTEPLNFQAIDQEKQTIRCIQAIELRKYRCMHGNLAMRSCTWGKNRNVERVSRSEMVSIVLALPALK